MTEQHILITGATGFIGSNVAHKFLAEKDYRVVAMVRGNRAYKNADDLRGKGAILVEGSFCDKVFTERVFEEFPVDCVIHLAALRGGGAGTANDFHEVNVQGTEVLLETALQNRVKKFIFCSSVGVFGTIPKTRPADLNTPLNGDNRYHHSKILAEKAVHRYIGLGLNACIIRPTITYGPGDNGFPATLVNLVRRRMFFLTFRDIRIHLLDVGSFADVIRALIDTEGGGQRIYLVADRDPVILRDLVDQIYIHYHNKPYPSFMRLPDGIFNLLALLFKTMKNEKWLTRILLISKDWYYDVTDTMMSLSFIPGETHDLFVKRMCGR